MIVVVAVVGGGVLPGVRGGVGGHPAGVGDLQGGPAVVGLEGRSASVHVGV